LRLGTRAPLVAAAMACAAAPALAYGGATAGGGFTAIDYAWQANGTAATTLTVAPGEAVTFGYPSGTTTHNVDFTGKQPSQCTGLTPDPRPKGWTAECTFDAAGSYPFVCDVHPQMVGTVVVAVPTPTPTATPAAPTDPAATPGATATPQPAPGATPTPTPTSKQATLKVKLAATQRGTRVRGSVTVAQPASRLEVTVKAGSAKVGVWVKTATKSGAVAFSVPLNAKARRMLKAKRRLDVTVAVALTPPGGKKLTMRTKAIVRPG
jgi:plastocyanin